MKKNCSSLSSFFQEIQYNGKKILSLDGRIGEYIISSKALKNAVQRRMWEKCECEERHFSFVFNSTPKAFWQHLWFSEMKILSVQSYIFLA